MKSSKGILRNTYNFIIHRKLELEINLLSSYLSVSFPNTGRIIHTEVLAEIIGVNVRTVVVSEGNAPSRIYNVLIRIN